MGSVVGGRASCYAEGMDVYRIVLSAYFDPETPDALVSAVRRDLERRFGLLYKVVAEKALQAIGAPRYVSEWEFPRMAGGDPTDDYLLGTAKRDFCSLAERSLERHRCTPEGTT